MTDLMGGPDAPTISDFSKGTDKARAHKRLIELLHKLDVVSELDMYWLVDLYWPEEWPQVGFYG